MTHEIQADPCSVAWFQAGLDKLSHDIDIQLRIVWAPSQVITRVIDYNGAKRQYKKYPILGQGPMRGVHNGNYYVRRILDKLQVVGYQKQGALVPPEVKPTDLAYPDIEWISDSVHIWVVEVRIPDEIAKKAHEEKRQRSINHLGIDLFGPFPQDGIWDWFADISQHRDGCCDLARSIGVFCQGLYRQPSNRDLRQIKRRIALYRNRPKKDQVPQQQQLQRDMTDAIENWEYSALKELMAEARESEALDSIAQSRSRVAMGVTPPRHRKAY